MDQLDPKLARIVVLDDEEGNLRVLRRLLTIGGYQNVLVTSDPNRALHAFEEGDPDLLLLDLHMPELDGFGVMERLASLVSPDDFVPILVLSGDLSSESRKRALAGGAKDFVSKPFDRDEVLLRIRNLLDARMLHKRVQRQNQDLERTVRERTNELHKAHEETLVRLARAAEYRDDDTGEHTRRVGEIAGDLAVRLALPAQDADLIRRAAPLHDVGKIGIPDAILLKPGKLTPEEFDTIKTHTTIGGKILQGSRTPLLQLAETIALCHHERWDGRGYPAGLAGASIPLCARVTAVADVFDALTHERPYKRAWSVEEALEEIKKQRERQFDPDVVDAMLARF
jgi:putative two-component system response regulator